MFPKIMGGLIYLPTVPISQILNGADLLYLHLGSLRKTNVGKYYIHHLGVSPKFMGKPPESSVKK